MKNEAHADRLLSVYQGWLRRIKWEMVAELDKGRTVTIRARAEGVADTRMDAANSLIETGMAVVVSRRMVRNKCGPVPASGVRRERLTITIAAPEKAVIVDDEARI